MNSVILTIKSYFYLTWPLKKITFVSITLYKQVDLAILNIIFDLVGENRQDITYQIK